MNFLITVLAFLVTLAILIVVHELGHYGAARWCGVKVLRFSVGFGRPIVKRVLGADRTEWVIGVLPLGGYVRMLDENDEDCRPIAASDLPRAFNRQSVWKRSFIVAAGPAANFLLAVFIYWLLAVMGTFEPAAVLASPPAGSVAARMGVQGGDQVRSFNSGEVRSFNDLRWQVLQAAAQRGEWVLVVQRGGATRELSAVVSPEDAPDLDGDVVSVLGFVYDAGPAIVQRVLPDMSAAQAGLRAGDEWLAIDHHPVRSARDVIERVRASAGATLSVQLLRAGERHTLALPVIEGLDRQGQRIGKIGVEFSVGPWAEVRYGPIESVVRACARTWEMALFSVRMLVRMVMGEVSLKNLSGPVTVADYAGQTARVGVVPYLTFLALISIGLGVLNLLPIPLLDGGHLLYHAAEIFTGKPPAQWLVEWGQRAGAAALLMLMALALYNDLARLLSNVS